MDQPLKKASSIAPLAITFGDAAGIGPEIIAKIFQTETAAHALVIGDLAIMQRAATLVHLNMPFHVLEKPQDFRAHHLNILPIARQIPADLPYGRIDKRAGAAAYQAITMAIDLALAGEVSGIVTAPIHKESLSLAGIKHPGHTEILGERTGSQNFGMMLAEGNLRVMLVSIHVSLRKALEMVNAENICRAISLADEGCRAFGIEKPRIAVAGLNPHAGEGGLFGAEESEIIAPAIKTMKARGFDVSGPYPPDTIFMAAKKGAYDCVIAQYHDQGLIPIKLNGLESGVNLTIGLPIIRTSPDHGTAFDIAGKGIASPASLHEAYAMALKMAQNKNGT